MAAQKFPPNPPCVAFGNTEQGDRLCHILYRLMHLTGGLRQTAWFEILRNVRPTGDVKAQIKVGRKRQEEGQFPEG